ncbi:MAG: acyltransferase [Anaerolineae bacterium]|nr:acyltransferase [Anaerolineae bacterium]
MARIGFFQFAPVFGQVERNLAHVVHALARVDADLIVLPELPFTGYHFRDRQELFHLAEDPQHSHTVDSLIALCRQRDLYLVTGFAERQRDRCFNSALLIGPQGIVHTYRKLHLFAAEKRCFDPGDTPLDVSHVRDLCVGMMICFDWVFPEVARALTLAGADLICHPANLVLAYCQQAMLTRCLENLVYAVTANRHGADARPHGEIAFTGGSQIVAPRGELIHRAPSDRPELHIVEIDVARARDKHLTPENDIRVDRRPPFYAALCDPAHSEAP